MDVDVRTNGSGVTVVVVPSTRANVEVDLEDFVRAMQVRPPAVITPAAVSAPRDAAPQTARRETSTVTERRLLAWRVGVRGL